MEYQESESGKIQYNDYAGYFENLESDAPLKVKNNVKLFKSLQSMIDEYFAITANQDMEQIKKDELVLEMATTMEQIYLNAGQPHLVETIGSSLCLILNKKDKVVSPSHIYAVLEKKYKNRYSCEVGRSKKGDIFSKRNVEFNEFRDNLVGVISFFNNLPNLDVVKIDEMGMLLNQFDDSRIRVVNEINGLAQNQLQDMKDIPEPGEEEEEQEEERPDTPAEYESKYYKRLEQYIQLLQKLKENVLKYPPSPRLDNQLDQALALEMEILMPSIDMKYKRSIPQLDETVSYADNQSLNGASSVMSEKALVEDFRGNVIDPYDKFNRYLEIPHKLTPEQIDTRRPYISIIRKKMQRYQPHLYYHLKWYEGAQEYEHNLSMGKFARSNLIRKKVKT